MRVLLTLLLGVSLLTTACKQEVDFGAVESTERPLGPVEPIIPVEPVPTERPPVVRILQAPQDSLFGLDDSNQAVFEVEPGSQEIESVACYVNGSLVPCNWSQGVVTLSDFPLGRHLFHVVATDVFGLSGEASEDWAVYQNLRKVVSDLNVDSQNSDTDILFVIDNSSSMRREQQQMSRRFNHFINQLKGVNWHIGITTTDTSMRELWTDGGLSPFENRDWFLTPSLGKKEAQKLFSKNVYRRENASDYERGIKAVQRSIERSLKGSSKTSRALRKFFRPEAALAVVIVSDEDESGDDKYSEGDRLIKLVDDTWGANKKFQFNSIVVHTSECLNGEGHTYGEKYQRLSRKTGGIIGDVCSDNYTQILKDIGQGVSNLTKVYNLSCDPQDSDLDGNPDIEVKSKNGSKLPGYTIDKRRIEFDQALNPGDYEFHYFCLK